MGVVVRPFEARDLRALSSRLAKACTWLPLTEILEEKLGPGTGDELPARAVAELDGRLVGVAITRGPWLRLLAVAPDERGHGVGSALLAWAEDRAAISGAERLSCCDEPGNYPAPGIDEGDTATIGWLERRGFGRHDDNRSLLIDLSDNPRVSEDRAATALDGCQQRGYRMRRLPSSERSAVVASVDSLLSPAWATEVARAAAPPSGVWIAERNQAVVGFAAHDGNNRGLGWFGPAWTDEAHRGQGLGAALLLACLRDVARAGHRQCTISWIGPRTFYDRVAGIAGEVRYAVMRKPIAPSTPP